MAAGGTMGRAEAGARAVDLRLYGLLDTGVNGSDGAVLARLGAEAVGRLHPAPVSREGHLRRPRDAGAPAGDPRRDRRGRCRSSSTTGRPRPGSGCGRVHLGQSDMHPSDARRLLGPQAIIGITVKNAPCRPCRRLLPVDYACIGGVFATTSKDNPDPPVGLDGLSRLLFRARLARGPGLPVGAIAGIGADNAAQVIAPPERTVWRSSRRCSAPSGAPERPPSARADR